MDEIDQGYKIAENPMGDDEENERQEVLDKLQRASSVIQETAETIQSLMRENWDIADISNDAYSAIAEMIQQLKQDYDFSSMMETNPMPQGLAESIEECGSDMGTMSPMSQPKQQDNVNMNVSLNASGQGGIRDLLDILQNIESGKGDVEMPVAIKSMGMELDDDFANEPDETYAPIDTMMPTGSDLHSKGIEAPKVNGGGNPMAHMERLENLYQQVKIREGSGPKEKQHSKYVDRNSPKSKAKVQEAKDKIAADKKAEPGKKLLAKINK